VAWAVTEHTRVAELEESGVTGFIVDDLQLIEQARKHRDATGDIEST